MRFGRIDYLNLLPFHVFMKRYVRTSRVQAALRRGAGVPSDINRAFRTRRVDAAFISSIEARRCRGARLGIVARGEVQSVLLIPGETMRPDAASATSNVLAEVLGLRGEVLIGDRALAAYLEGVEAIDLALAWREREAMPFVFAVLCAHTRTKRLRRLERAFMRSPKRIPYYLLQEASRKSGIPAAAIVRYLQGIDYVLDHRERRGLRRFYALADRLPT